MAHLKKYGSKKIKKGSFFKNIDANLGRFAKNLGRFAKNLGRFAKNLGRFAKNLGRFAKNLGRFAANSTILSPKIIKLLLILQKNDNKTTDLSPNSLIFVV